MENRITLSKRVEGKSRLWVTLLLLCFCSFTWAQVKVTGVVTDPSGEAIIGANIVEKGVPGNGTISDIDGNFTLNVKSNKATVTVSFIGYKDKTVALNGSTNLKVTLEEDSQSLDEVVVVGYGSVKKSNLTSVSKMTSEAIEGRPVTNLSDALSGQLAGVQTQTSSGIPGEEMQITVRGVSSINGSSNPLIVVDGVITENMSNVNPSDVASIQVLKDAAATSIYGARGSAGVILIETKQAQKGAPVVKWESYLGFQNAVGLPEMMSPKEWMAYNLYLKNAMWLQKDGNNTLDTPNKDRPSGDRVNPDWLLNPNSDTADWTLRSDLPQTDWVDAILQTAFTHSHQVSVSSKGDRYSIYASAGYLNQEGIVKHTGYERFNFRINASMNINKHIKAGVNFAPTISSQDRGESEGKDKVIMTALTMIPTIGINEGTRSLGFSKFRKDDVNPYERLRQVTDSRNIKNFDVASWVEANIIKGLTFKSMFNYSSENRIDEYFLPLDVQKMSVKSATASSKVISGSRTGWQNTLSYDFTLWKKHQMNVLLGQSIENRSIYTADMKATDFPLDNVPTLNQGATPSQASTLKNIVRTASLFGRLSYNYDDKYLLMFTMRADGSSKYQEHWGYFPSVGAAWVLSEESFLKDQKWIDFLKLRASWGKLGNDQVAASDGFASIATGNAASGVFGNSTIAGYQNSTYFSWLKWEVVEEWNAGINFITLNNRLNIDVDYYHRMTNNAVIAPLLPFSTTTLAGNYGKILNSGIDVSANWNDKIGRDFSYNIGVNISTLRNRVKDLNGNSIIRGGKTVNIVGKEMNSFYGFKMIGVYQTEAEIAADPIAVANGCVPGDLKYADLDGNNVLDGNDRTTLGSYIPNFTYGINLGLNYKNLDFQLTTYGQAGAQMFNRKRALRYSTQNYNFDRAQYKNRWTGPGSTNSDPWAAALLSLWNVSDQKYSSYFVESADYFRIQNVTLGYTFRNLKLGNYTMPGLRLSLTADRPFTTFKANAFTPELSDSQGWDTEVYPLTSTYTLGLRIDF